jgi:integrase
MGFGNQLVAHGLRSMANTTLNENSFDPNVIEAALAHIGENEVQKTYNRAEFIERRKSVMARWNNYIENAATGNFSLVCNVQQIKVG